MENNVAKSEDNEDNDGFSSCVVIPNFFVVIDDYFLKRRVRKYLLICDYFVDNRKDPLIQVRVID